MLAETGSSTVEAGWRASLELEFAPAFGRTVVSKRKHSGPLCLQKPFHPGDGSCHAYVLHPPGGLAGGDDVALTAVARAGANALITMPASTKFYRTESAASRLGTRLEVEADAVLEWLPTESMLFGGSLARLDTSIHLQRGARFIGWEALAFGRPLHGDHYRTGRFAQTLSVHLDGQPLLLERMTATAGDELLTADWGLAGLSVAATWLAYPADQALLESVRAALPASASMRHGATLVDGLLVLRVLGPKLEPLRLLLEAARVAATPSLLGRAALAPRIWNT
jgi:urease accessory protein